MRSRAFVLSLLVVLAGRALADGPTEEEALAWARRVEGSLGARAGGFLDASIDRDAIAARAFSGLAVKDETKARFLDDMKSGKGYGTALVASLGKKGSWKFLRIVKRGASLAAVFRLLPEAGGFSYDELLLGKNANGETCVVDAFAYATGLRLSTQAREAALSVALAEDKALADRLEGVEAELARHMTDLATMTRQNGEKKWSEALDTYKRLPEVLRKSHMVRLRALLPAREVGKAEYKALLDEVEKDSGDDPALALVLHDHALLEKDWTRALAHLDTVDKAIGGDTYLEAERGEVHLGQGDLASAKAKAKKALDAEPDLKKGHWVLVAVANRSKDWPGLRSELEALEKLGVKLNDLSNVAAYADFVKTDEYRAWRKGHDSK